MAITPPQPLIDAIKANKCILFVGSGLSAAAGYPTWSELVGRMVAEARTLPNARTGGIEQFVQSNDLLTLADFSRTTLGKYQYSRILRQQLEGPVQPTRAHEVIALREYRGIITTNYDRLLETTMTIVRRWTPSTFTAESVSLLATALYTSAPFIFKLHGDVGSPESIVLTSQDYDRLILLSPHVRSFLQAVFLNYTLLFVGYSLQDPDFRLALRELTLIFEGYTPTHYALLPDAAEFTVDHLLTRMNIHVLPYSPQDDHAEVTAFLEVMQREAPYLPVTAR